MSARILVIDIETSPNLAYCWGLFKENISLSQIKQVGQVISFAAKWHGEKGVQFWSDHHDGHAKMLRAAHALLDEADIVVHWNGSAFDIPHLNREFALHGLTPPSPYKQIDLCLQVRKHFRFTSNKLDHVAQQLGVGKKVSHAGFPLWVGCMAGEDKAWATMRRYNKQDVVITDKVYVHLKPWISSHPHLALYSGNPLRDVCGRCGGPLQRRGTATTLLGIFQRFQCTKCGGWSKSGKRIVGVGARPA